MAKEKIDFRLYEFPKEIQDIQDYIDSNIDLETGEFVGEIPIEQAIQDRTNMEMAREKKVLSIGKLIKHYDHMADSHESLEARHAKKKRAAQKAVALLKKYIKDNVPADFKAKDEEVSIYPHKSSFVMPLVTVEETPAEFKRPSMKPNYDRQLAQRIENSCKKQGLDSPFEWEHDKAAMKDEIKANPNFPLGRLEEQYSMVVRG